MGVGFQIGKVARQTGLSVDTIRFYEKENLLREPPRSEGGFRLYGQRDIEHLLFIRRAQQLGFSLAEIRELLLIQDERTGACTHVRELIVQRLTSVKEKIQDLKRLENELDKALSDCNGALAKDSADSHQECCPVLDQISHSNSKKEGI